MYPFLILEYLRRCISRLFRTCALFLEFLKTEKNLKKFIKDYEKLSNGLRDPYETS